MRNKQTAGVWCGVVIVSFLLGGYAQKTAAPRPISPQVMHGEEIPAVASQPTSPSSQETRSTQPVAEHATITPHRLTQGEVLYLRNCADCHGWEGKGDGPVGKVLLKKPPSLRNPALFANNSEAEIVARVLLGKDLAVPLASTAVQETEGDVSAILMHMRRMPSIPWKEVVEGQKVYDSLCLSCHGIYGRGDGLMSPSLVPRPRDLSDPAYQKQVSDEDLFRVISEGTKGMPGTADVLSAPERKAVISFVRLLSPGYELYDRFCEVCHGGMGIPPEVAQRELFGDVLGKKEQRMPVFNKKYFQTHTDEQLRGWVRHMLKQNRAVMPHFAGELNAEEVRQILAYLRSLPPAA